MTHIWFFKGVPSRLGYLLDIAPKDLEKVIYFAAYMVTKVDEEQRHQDLLGPAAGVRQREPGEVASNQPGRGREAPQRRSCSTAPRVRQRAKKVERSSTTSRPVTAQVAATLDALKDLGFTRAPWSGVSFAFSDVIQPPELDEYIEKYEGEADKVENYEIGMLTEEERRQELVDLWTKCTSEVSEAVEEHCQEQPGHHRAVRCTHDAGAMTKPEGRDHSSTGQVGVRAGILHLPARRAYAEGVPQSPT